jgi:hypothetical protein
MPTGRRRLASSLRAAEPSSPNEAKALSNNPADNTYSAELLRGLLDDGGVLSSMWAAGYTSVNTLWDAFARYPYLPRMKNQEVLCATVRQGANPISWQITGFAIADAFNAKTGHYVGLTTSGDATTVIGTTLVVRPDAATGQLHEAEIQVVADEEGGPGATPVPRDGNARSAVDDRLRRFYAVVRLDPERYQRDFAKLAAEVIANLAGFLGTDIEISVEIKATNPEGFPDYVSRTVTENARTLKLDSYGFETE